MDRKGLVGVAKFGLVVCFVTVLVVLSTIGFFDVLSIQSYPNGTFAAYGYYDNTATGIIINWTGPANMTLEPYFSNTMFRIDNQSTRIYGIYWQNESYSPSFIDYQNLTDQSARCFAYGSITGPMGFAVQNNLTGLYNQTTINMTNSTYNSTLFNLSYYAVCPPGVYSGNFSVVGVYNESDKVNITATIIIPLSSDNVINLTSWNYTAFVHGRIPPNATYYHSYYFNPDVITNATGLTINMSGFTTTLGIYLIHQNGSVLAQAENSSSVEIPYFPLNGSILSDAGRMLELRVYGNFSTGSLQPYNLRLFFSHLNITGESNAPLGVLDFGTLYPNSKNTSVNFSVLNMGGKNISGINQTIDLYWIRRWSNIADDQAQNGTQSNFSVIVPNFTTGIEAVLEWRNGSHYVNLTDWNLFLIDPSGRIVASSTNNFMNSNFSNATSTERIIYSGPVFNSSNTGIWNITVNSSVTYPLQNRSAYNVRVKLWFNLSNGSWVATNFTGGYPFNQLSSSNLENFSRYVNANITVPSTQLLNGTYEGYIQYSDAGANGEGSKMRLPIKFQIYTGMLVINNSIYNTTLRYNENTGLHRSISFNISMQNPGGSSIIYIATNSSNLTNGNSYMNFTMDNYNQVKPAGVLAANANSSINITVMVNTSNTANTQGLYTGWITFNITQNNTNNISIHNIFNISIEVNLTSNLVVNITEYLGYKGSRNPYMNDSNTTENITMLINVSLQNGTIISSDDYKMNEANFTSVTATEGNVTSYSFALTTIRSGRGTVCLYGFCMINATVPAGMPGGRYNLRATATWNTSHTSSALTSNLSGSGTIYPLVIYAPGIKLAALTSTGISMGEYLDRYFNVSVTNYGPAGATGIVFMNNSCIYAVVNASSVINTSGCTAITATQSNNYFALSNFPGNGTQCWLSFKVHSVNVSGSKSCTDGMMNVSTGLPMLSDNVTGITVSIDDTDGTSGGVTTGTGGSTTSYTYNRSVKITSYTSAFSAKAGENISTTVSVKNTGNTTSIVWLTATTNNSGITTAVGPTFASLTAGATGTYTAYMNVSNSSRLGLAAGTLKAYVEGYTDTWYDTKPFDFTVLSTPEREAELNRSFANYTAQLANLTAVFNAIKASGLVDIGNLTRVGELLNASSDVLQSINEAINASNYAAAETLMIDLAGRLARIQAELTTLEASKAAGEQKFLGDFYVWVVIGLVIAGAAGVVIYMMLPPKPGSGFRRIKGLKIKPRLPHREEKKAGGSSVFGKLKGKFKRKEKGSMGDADAIKRQVGDISDYAEMKGGKIEYLTARYAEGYERAMDKGGRKSLSKKLNLKRFKKPQKKLGSFAKK